MRAIPFEPDSAAILKAMDRVCDDREPVVLSRGEGRSVVMLALDDFEALEETASLLRSPENARRLLAAVAELESGGGVRRELVE